MQVLHNQHLFLTGIDEKGLNCYFEGIFNSAFNVESCNCELVVFFLNSRGIEITF